MIYLDSWVWLEYGLRGDQWTIARDVIDDARENELSYADAIHVATATLLDCDELHTGDSDFETVEEVPAVVH